MKVNNFGGVETGVGGGPGGSGGGGGGGGGTGPIGGDVTGPANATVVGKIQNVPVDVPSVNGTVATFVLADGRIEWLAPGGGSTEDGMTPFYIAPSTTFTVPLYKQALFKDIIEVDGILVVLGRLNGVD